MQFLLFWPEKGIFFLEISGIGFEILYILVRNRVRVLSAGRWRRLSVDEVMHHNLSNLKFPCCILGVLQTVNTRSAQDEKWCLRRNAEEHPVLL